MWASVMVHIYHPHTSNHAIIWDGQNCHSGHVTRTICYHIVDHAGIRYGSYYHPDTADHVVIWDGHVTHTI